MIGVNENITERIRKQTKKAAEILVICFSARSDFSLTAVVEPRVLINLISERPRNVTPEKIKRKTIAKIAMLIRYIISAVLFLLPPDERVVSRIPE